MLLDEAQQKLKIRNGTYKSGKNKKCEFLRNSFSALSDPSLIDRLTDIDVDQFNDCMKYQSQIINYVTPSTGSTV
jgi:hypothetical protein